MGNLSLLQGIFPTQGSNPGLPYCRWILYQLSYKGSLHAPKESLKSAEVCVQQCDSKYVPGCQPDSASINHTAMGTSVRGSEVKAMALFLFPALIPPLAGDAASQVIFFKRKISCTFLGIYPVF